MKVLHDMSPEDGRLLKENMRGDRRVAVHLGEGWHVPRALLTVAEKRGLLLIDLPFEQLDEMKRCAVASPSPTRLGGWKRNCAS